MADQVTISGEFCTLTIENTAVAASRSFAMSIDRGSYGNFIARGTSKWRKNYVSDIGATIDIDGLIVVQDASPTAHQFDDLFTYITGGTQLTIVFTLRTATPGEKIFIYTCEAYLTALNTSAPQFGEATYSASLIVTGAIEQTFGTVS